jgi:putative copper resistance protein D
VKARERRSGALDVGALRCRIYARQVPIPLALPLAPAPLLAVPAHAAGGEEEALPRFGASAIWTQWGLDPWLFVLIVWVLGAYLYGAWLLHRRGDRWPVGRTLAFSGGMLLFYFATSSGLAAYDDTLLSVHMVQHMLLMMPVPLLLALGAPVTLALRTFPARPRRWLLGLLHSRFARVVTFAPLTLAIYIASPWVLYYTGWYSASLHHDWVHELMHLHLVLAGSIFFWPLVGADPIPGRLSHPFRLLLVFLTLPFHAFLGVTVMSQTSLIGGDWYPSLHRTMSWLPDPLDDQHLAGGILWGSGDLIGLVFFAVLFVQWVRASMKEAQREDRRLDRLERAGR